MFLLLRKSKNTLTFRSIIGILIGTFVLMVPGNLSAQMSAQLPVPGTMLGLSAQFNAPLIKGLAIHPENPLQFDFLIDPGNVDFKGQDKAEEYRKVIKYFLAALTVPEKDMWVNLSPYEKDRIIPDDFGRTEMGRDLLGQDYILKQITASLLHPEKDLGKSFWKKVYQQAQEKFGTTDIPVSTFNKVWIIPDKASVYEKGTTVFLIESHLKVMLEEDYIALARQETRDQRPETKNNDFKSSVSGLRSEVSGLSSQIVREIILPAIEKEVNEGKNFSLLRQINNSLILATWYKRALKESLLGKIYVDRAKTDGVNQEDVGDNQKIYEEYLMAFKKGAYNFIKEEIDPATQETIPRRYFSGGYSTRDAAGHPLADRIEILSSADQRVQDVLKKSSSAVDNVYITLNEAKPDSANLAKMIGQIPHRRGQDQEDSIYSVNEAIARAVEANRIAELALSVKKSVEEYIQNNAQVKLALNDLGIDAAGMIPFLKSVAILSVDDVLNKSPFLVLKDAQNYQVAHIGRSFTAIYLGRGFINELMASTDPQDQELLNGLIVRELVALVKGKELYDGQNYDEAVQGAEAPAEQFEKAVLVDRLDTRLQVTTKHFIEQYRSKYRMGLLQGLRYLSSGLGIKLDEKLDDFHLHQNVVEQALTLSLAQQTRFFTRYQTFLKENRASINLYTENKVQQAALSRFASELKTGYYQAESFTSYPAQELIALDYLREFKPEVLQAATQEVRAQVPALTADLSSEELFGHLNQAANKIIAALHIHPDFQLQVRNALVTEFYHATLSRENTEPRIVQLSETTSRDGQQSNSGTNMTGEQQRDILKGVFRYGISRVETWGGAVVQAAILDTTRKGSPPEDPFFNLRSQTSLLKEVLLESLGTEKISSEDMAQIMDRFEVRADRKILSIDELNAILKRNNVQPETQAKVRKAYSIRQEMLLRGQYIVGLMPYPAEVLKKFVETAYKNGVDTFRIFDAFNDARKIIRAIEAVKALNNSAKVQPVIHYTEKFPQGIAGYVRVAKQLIEASGNSIDTLTIKDAGGLLEAGKAYELIKALRDAGIAVPIQVHTHDVAGNRQLTLLEAIRANGSQYPIVVDVATGELAGPFAQPNTRHFLKLVEGTNWNNQLNENMDFSQMDSVEQYIHDSVMPLLPIAPITTAQRQDIKNVGMPGGMKTNFDRELDENLRGYAKQIDTTFGLTIFDAQGKFTAQGSQFRDAFYKFLFEEMKRVTSDMGEISRVTPTSDWIGKQSFNNVMGWIIRGYVDMDKATGALKRNSTLAEMPRRKQYQQGLTRMIEGLQNYLIERSQDPVLADLYPTVDRGLALLAFELDGIGGVLLSEAGTIKNGSLAEYQKLREALDKDVVDLPTIKLLKAIKEAAKAGNSKTPEETAKAQKAIEAQEFTRDVILTGMENLPKEVNIARSWDEYALQRTQLKNKYPHINDTDEDLLLIALFPRDNQVGNLFKQREEAFKHLAQSGGQDVVSERYTETALRALGLTELADQQQRLRIVSSSSVTSGTKMENPGGIDLNPANLNLQIKRDGQGVPLPVNLQDLPNINVNGFVPVIINISPVKSLPALLLGEAQTAPASSPATMARQKKKG